MAKSEQIKVKDLLVNTENYRFESVTSQKEAMDKMVSDQGDKLFNLAEDIIKSGLNPNDKIQVVVSNHDKTKYNVVEGNRRSVVLKLLNNPDLLDSERHSLLKKKFKKLIENNQSQIIKVVECTIYDNPSEADKWIKLKHGGESEGIGTVKWNAQQIQRFEEKVEGKSSAALQVIKILQNSSEVPETIRTNLRDLKITNLGRLLSDPDVRDMLGIEINNGILQSEIEKEEVVKGLSQVAKDLLNPKFKVGEIYTKDDRKDYIRNFPKEQKPNINNKSKEPWEFIESDSTQKKTSQSKPKKNPKDRSILIPKTCVLNINKPKLNSIYHELQKLDINRFTNASAVLLRVFVELSLDCYIEEYKLTSSLSSAKSGLDFQQKVFLVANHLETKKLADSAICKGIKFSIKNKNDILGIDTWHAYVHNNRFSPTANNLIPTWDGIQDFIIILWNNIK